MNALKLIQKNSLDLELDSEDDFLDVNDEVIDYTPPSIDLLTAQKN